MEGVKENGGRGGGGGGGGGEWGGGGGLRDEKTAGNKQEKASERDNMPSSPSRSLCLLPPKLLE